MKVRLSIGQIPLSGYVNIDPAPRVESEMGSEYKIVAGDIRNIDATIEDADCTELLIDGGLDYIFIDNIIPVVEHWCKKLRHKGYIILKGNNLATITQMFLNGELTTLDFNNLLFGVNTHPWNCKSGCVSAEDIVEILKDCGLNIQHIGFHQGQFIIKAQRP